MITKEISAGLKKTSNRKSGLFAEGRRISRNSGGMAG